MSSSRLILASTSPWREELLARFGLPFECRAPEVDEGVWKARVEDPVELVQGLAELKARAVARIGEECWVIGADQMAVFGATRLDKPGSVSEARRQLRLLAGREHQLHTGWFVLRCRDAAFRAGVDTHRLRMHPLTDTQIDAYIRRDNPLSCAGSYRIEGLGSALFSEIRGVDATAIVGLPLMAVAQALRTLGFDVLTESP